MFKEDQGVPRWRLVIDCLYIYSTYKPGEATASEGGSFHQFVWDVFEYATGKEGETHAKVDQWVRKLVVPSRRIDELEEQRRALTDEIEAASRSDDIEGASALFEKKRNIERELFPLYAKTWPHDRRIPKVLRA
jgi:hypothetical protein